MRIQRRGREVDSSRAQICQPRCAVRQPPPPHPEVRCEEILAEYRAPMGAEKRPPRHRSLTARWDPVFFEDVGHGRPRHAMLEILQRTLNPGVAPARVLRGHADHQTSNLCVYPGPSGSALRDRSLPDAQVPMPAQNGVSRDKCRDLGQDRASELRAEDRQPSPLGIGQTHTSPTQLRLQHSVLGFQILDHLLLLARDPADEHREQHLQRQHRGRVYSVDTPSTILDITGSEPSTKALSDLQRLPTDLVTAVRSKSAPGILFEPYQLLLPFSLREGSLCLNVYPD